MARLIVKSPYIKCGAGQSAGGYLKYIATRERVEIIPDDRPPTNKQEQLIAKLVEDFPDAKELMEYEDYLSHPTKATASALITLALESNWDRVQGMEGYAKYIALRPRAERLGEHGLFGDEDGVVLDKAMEENLIFRNPAAGCKLPSAKPREMKVLIPEEIQRLLIQAREGLL